MAEGWKFWIGRVLRDCTIYVAKIKALSSCMVTVQLICTFVFAYAKAGFLMTLLNCLVGMTLAISLLTYSSHCCGFKTLSKCEKQRCACRWSSDFSNGTPFFAVLND